MTSLVMLELAATVGEALALVLVVHSVGLMAKTLILTLAMVG